MLSCVHTAPHFANIFVVTNEGTFKSFMKTREANMKPHPALAVPLVIAGCRQRSQRNSGGKPEHVNLDLSRRDSVLSRSMGRE